MRTARQAAANWQRNMGRSVSNYVVGMSASPTIAALRERYVRGEIGLEAFEAHVERLLRSTV